MFADGGQVLAVVLALCWTAAVGYAEGVRRGLLVGSAPRIGVLAALGVAVLLFGLQARLGTSSTTGGGAPPPWTPRHGPPSRTFARPGSRPWPRY
jgi:hypothetical protein